MATAHNFDVCHTQEAILAMLGFNALGMLFRSDCDPSEGESCIYISDEAEQEEKAEENAVDKGIEDLRVAKADLKQDSIEDDL